MREPKARLRTPEDKYRTHCGRRVAPWRTLDAAEVPGLIAAGQIGLTDKTICQVCRRRANLPPPGPTAGDGCPRRQSPIGCLMTSSAASQTLRQQQCL